MSRIRGRGNKKTEVALIELMREHGIKGWRRNRPVFGRPDFVFPGKRVAVFVDGCFWHGCPEHYNVPVNNAEFWRRKLESNRARDERVTSTLESRGWTVVRVWEHELRKSTRSFESLRMKVVERLEEALEARSLRAGRDEGTTGTPDQSPGQAAGRSYEGPSDGRVLDPPLQDESLGMAAEERAEYEARDPSVGSG